MSDAAADGAEARAAAPRASERRAFVLALAVVLAVAAGLRLWHVLALRQLPLFEQLLIDSSHYDAWARRIAAGDWLGDRAFYMDPGYPYALAVLYRLLGRDLLVVRLSQVALGVGTCGLVAWIGHRVGGRRVALAAAAAVALYQPLVFEEAEVEKTALGVFLVTAALALATGASIASRFGAGACLAAAALTRGNLLLLAPVAFVVFLVEGAPPAAAAAGPAATGAGRALLRLRPPLAFAAGFLLVTAPVLWRNHRVSGEWILTTSQLGQNLYTGNNPVNFTGAYTPVPFVRPNPSFEELDFAARAEAMTGRRMPTAEVSSFWLRQTLLHVAAHPGFAAKVLAKKAVLMVSDYEVPDGWSARFLRRFSPGLRLAFLTFAWLLPLAALGAVATFRSVRASRVLVGYAVAYSASLVAFFVLSRYRIFVAPALAVLAGAGAVWIADAVRAGRRRALAAAGAACAALAALSLAGSRVTGLPETEADSFASLAMLYQAAGDLPRAEGLLREGLREDPGAAPLRYGLGSLRLAAGDGRGALAELEAARAVDPTYPNLWFAMGFAHEELNDPERALACYEEQLARTPSHEGALSRIAALRARPAGAVAPR